MFRCVILETRPREACHLTLTSSCCCIIYSSATRLLFQSFRTCIQITKNQRRSLMDGTAGFVRTRKRLYVYTPFGFFISQAVPNLLSKCNIYRERVAKIKLTLKSNRSVLSTVLKSATIAWSRRKLPLIPWAILGVGYEAGSVLCWIAVWDCFVGGNCDVVSCTTS